MMREHSAIAVEGHQPGETWVERSAPWISSTLMHAGFGLLGAFVLFASIRPAPVEQYEYPMSIQTTADPDKIVPPATGEQNDAALNTDKLKSMQNMFKEHNNGVDPWGKTDSVKNALAGFGERANTDIPFIGLGNKGGSGVGDRPGGSDGPGSLAAFGPRVETGGSLLGRSRARRTVYLLDHSGSMLDTFDYLRNEVEKATLNLTPAQRFAVVMFSEDVTVLGPEQLQRASDDVKRDVIKRLGSVRASGHNDGELAPFQKGFEKAFAMNPEVIIFLTDGEFDPRLVDVVKKLNQSRPKAQRVEVHTIAYVQIGIDAAESLKKIAAENAGRYKFVTAKDLQ